MLHEQLCCDPLQHDGFDVKLRAGLVPAVHHGCTFAHLTQLIPSVIYTVTIRAKLYPH